MKSITLTVIVDDNYILKSVVVQDNTLGLKTTTHEQIVGIAKAIVEDDEAKKKNDSIVNEALNIINSKK